jgi:hypothetical protein
MLLYITVHGDRKEAEEDGTASFAWRPHHPTHSTITRRPQEEPKLHSRDMDDDAGRQAGQSKSRAMPVRSCTAPAPHTGSWSKLASASSLFPVWFLPSGGYHRRRRPELRVLHLGHAVEHAQRRHVAHHRHLLRQEVDVERFHACVDIYIQRNKTRLVAFDHILS